MSSAGMITDQHAAGVCSLAGLATMKSRWITLDQINKAMELNIREAEGAENEADIVRTILFGLRLTKASCDAMIDVLGTVTGPAGEAISTAYSGASPLAEEVGKFTAGQSSAAGWAKAGNAAAMAAAKHAAGDNYGDLIELQKIKSDLLIDAANKDVDEVLKDLGEYSLKLTGMTLKFVGKKTWARVLDIGKTLVKAGREYASSYREFRDNDLNLESAKRLFRARQKSVQQALTALETAIANCELELASSSSAAPVFKSMAPPPVKRMAAGR